MNPIRVLTLSVAKKMLYAFAFVVLAAALIGCGGKRAPSSPTAVPSPSLVTAHSTALPDLSSPPDGWIAFRTPQGLLGLVSPDGSRSVRLTEAGNVERFLWSPDGSRLALGLHSGMSSVQLAMVDIEDSRLTSLTALGTVEPDFTWSQDGRFLAYLWRLDPQEARSPVALHVMDLTSGQVISVTTYSYSLIPEPEIPSLCPQAFPYPLLPVCMVESPGRCSLDIWNVQTSQKAAALGSIPHCGHVWLPTGEGLFIPRVEWGEERIKQIGVEDDIYPLSLAWWRRGDEAPEVILRGTKRQSYRPVRWLSEGRLLFRAMAWEKDEYEGPAEPERIEYRLLSVGENGRVQEIEGDLPWWAAAGVLEQWAATWWEVGPDEGTVIFTRWLEGEEGKSAIYLWRGEGEPVYLAEGMYPQWQPR